MSSADATAVPKIYLLDGMLMGACACRALGPAERTSQRFLEIEQQEMPSVELDQYSGEDLFQADAATYFCTDRLQEALSALPGMKFLRARCIRNHWAPPNLKLPRYVWEIVIDATVPGRDFMFERVKTMTGEDCEYKWEFREDCRQYVVTRHRAFRPYAPAWKGAHLFWMTDQIGYWKGPIATEQFVKLTARFNLGGDIRKCRVKWGGLRREQSG